MGKSFWISFSCAGIGIIGWILLLVVVLGFKGGHPPLSAYVAFPVIVVSIVCNSLGGAIGLLDVYRRVKAPTALKVVSLANVSLVAISVLVLLWMLL